MSEAPQPKTIWVEFYDIYWDRIYQAEVPLPTSEVMKSLHRWSDTRMPDVRVAPLAVADRNKLFAEEQANGEKDWRS